MEEKAILQLTKQKKEQSERFILEGLRLVEITEKIKKELESINQIKKLTITGCKLSSLSNFPVLKNLKELNLSENLLKDADILNLQTFTELKYLFLSGNKIRKLESLNFIKNFTNLKVLDVFGCPFTNKENYIKDLFKLCPSLEIIDQVNQDGDEVTMDYYSDESEIYSEEEIEKESVENFLVNDQQDQSEQKMIKKTEISNQLKKQNGEKNEIQDNEKPSKKLH